MAVRASARRRRRGVDRPACVCAAQARRADAPNPTGPCRPRGACRPCRAANQQRAATFVEVHLGQRQRLADPQSGAPQHDDQATQPGAVNAVTGLSHDRDDLLDWRRVRRVSEALVPRWASGEIPRQSGRRPTAAGGVEQRRDCHEPSIGWTSEFAGRPQRTVPHVGLPREARARQPCCSVIRRGARAGHLPSQGGGQAAWMVAALATGSGSGRPSSAISRA
jgi:hypothetical protein